MCLSLSSARKKEERGRGREKKNLKRGRVKERNNKEREGGRDK
jgi:hypothetical protein